MLLVIVRRENKWSSFSLSHKKWSQSSELELKKEDSTAILIFSSVGVFSQQELVKILNFTIQQSYCYNTKPSMHFRSNIIRWREHTFSYFLKGLKTMFLLKLTQHSHHPFFFCLWVLVDYIAEIGTNAH